MRRRGCGIRADREQRLWGGDRRGSDDNDDNESAMVGYSDSDWEIMPEVEAGLLDTQPQIAGFSVIQVSKLWTW